MLLAPLIGVPCPTLSCLCLMTDIKQSPRAAHGAHVTVSAHDSWIMWDALSVRRDTEGGATGKTLSTIHAT